MRALATRSPAPAHHVSVRRPRLHAVRPAPRRRRLPAARSVAAYALGLAAGSLLVGVASVPGGAGVVTGQLVLAGAAGLVAVLARARGRATAARRPRRAV